MPENNYLGNLAFQLRWRRLPESTVASTIQEVRAEAAASQSTPAELFGPEKTYAESFPKGKATSTGFWIITIAVAIAALMVGVRVVTSIISEDASNPLVSLAILLGAVVIAFVGTIVGAMVDHRLPKGME